MDAQSVKEVSNIHENGINKLKVKRRRDGYLDKIKI